MAVILLAASASTLLAEPVFNRISTFPVAANLPAGTDVESETSSEIIAASEDGMTLIYTDSPFGAVGFIDISDPRQPKAGGVLMVGGEPTSVSVVNGKAVAVVNTSSDYVSPSGKLMSIDIASREIVASCELGGQPDSVAVAPDGSFAAIAIENERDEDLNDGAMPQLPAGDLVIVPLKEGAADCTAIRRVGLAGLARVASGDPEPEFVDINENGEIAVTLQENNHIVIVDGVSGGIVKDFSAGSVDLAGIDVKKDGRLDFTGSAKGVKREPDAVKWLDNERLVVANEGDYEGGARGFTIFSRDGEVLYEAGASLEREIARIGHYPDKRSGKKGIEPEGLEIAEFDGRKHIFVLSERASVIGVYREAGAKPELIQLLPSGIGPESAVAIPERGLLISANETDLVEDGGARSHVMIYELAEGKAAYPQIVSANKNGQPIGWGALSGLAADPRIENRLYAVSDSFYGAAPSIFVIDAAKQPAIITDAKLVTRNGDAAQKLDLEGIAVDGQGGYWLASEGKARKLVPHALIHVNAKGEIFQEIALPEELAKNALRFGFEGIAISGAGEDAVLWMAMQREWKDDPKGLVKLVSYKPASGEWGAVHYPLDVSGKGWVGLSEIAIHGNSAYLVERDNQIGEAAKIKRIYRVALADMVPASLGGELPVMKKTLVRDLLKDMSSATNGFVLDKIEGFAIDASGRGYAVTDNDGVDDSSGETLFWSVDMNMVN